MSEASDEKIGFVGVGRMGANMARRLSDEGYAVSVVYDIERELASGLAGELGCLQAGSLRQVSAAADVIFTVVSDDRAALSLLADGDDNLLLEGGNKTLIHCATLSPATQVELASRANQVGIVTLEACMASSIPQARNGELFLMIGGVREEFERHQNLLGSLAAELRYIGGHGDAAKVKALVNMVMNINTAGLAEGLGLGHALGLDLPMLCEIFSRTGANSRVLETDGEDMLRRDHDCYFSAAHAAKDSGIANALGRELGLTLPLSSATEAQYNRLSELGLGELDKSGVAELTFPGRAGNPKQ